MCSEPLTSLGQSTKRQSLVAALAVVVFAAVLWLPQLPTSALRHWDEAWYAQMSREVFESDDWTTLRWNNDYLFHKPMLSFWATIGAYQLFGINEFSARLFSFLCGLGIVASVTLFVARQSGIRWGILAGLLVIALPEFSRYCCRGQLDAPVTLFIIVQLVSFWWGRENTRWHLAGGVAFGLALMTKGAAAALALLVEGAYAIVSGDRAFLRQRSWWGSLLLGALIAAPWHIEQIVKHGEPFVRDYFSRHLGQFFFDIYPEVTTAGAPATYYLDFLIRKQPEWGLIALAIWVAATVVVLRRRSNRLLVFAWCWVTIIPLALSMSWAKWSWYLVPVYPGLAILTTLCLKRWLAAPWQRSAAIIAAIVVGIVVNGIAIMSVANKEFEEDIRAMAPVIREAVPPGGSLLTLQVESARQSMYPVATRFYGQRHVHVVTGLDELNAVISNAGNVVPALVNVELLEEICSRGRGESGANGAYDVEIVAVRGHAALVRMVPGWLAEEIRQAARNSAESR